MKWNKTTEQRFFEKVRRSDVAPFCWEWTAYTNRYGTFYDDGIMFAHRWMFAFSRSIDAPQDRVLHRCDNPACVNPFHLFGGSLSDNSQDMVRKGRCWALNKTHCPRGHAYTEENTRRGSNKKGAYRQCRECEKQRYLALKAKSSKA
jgi:hypothetical protein